MKALSVISCGGPAVIVEKEQPVCQSDTILVKNLYSGVSNGTERTMMFGGNYYMPFPYSFNYLNISEVVECGNEITKFKKGDIVYSATFTGHMEYFLLKETDLILKMNEDDDLIASAYLGLAGVAYHNVALAGIGTDDKVLVFGGGMLGQIVAQIAVDCGAKVTITERQPDRLELAKKLVKGTVINTDDPGDVEILEKSAPYSIVFETTGANVLDQIIGTDQGTSCLLGHRSKLMLIAGRWEIKYSHNAAQVLELCIQHGTHFVQEDLNAVGSLLRAGRIQLDPLITRVVPFSEAPQVYDILANEPSKLMGSVFCYNE